jgi:glycosyltransferase involved in cell wall biosynthesis
VKFSLLVVTTDRLHPTERLFRSLAAQTHKDVEVLFVYGEACAADALALARRYAGALDVRTLASPTPALSRARNMALPLLTGDFVAFPDDDCAYCPDTLEKALAFFAAHPEADVLLAAGKALREADARTYSATNATGKMRVKGHHAPCGVQGQRPCRGRGAEPPQGSGQSPGLRVVNRYAAFRRSGTIVQFYRRRCVEAVGPFDEELGPGTDLPYGCGEDTDYVLRALAAGFRVYRTHSVVVRHEEVNPLDPPPAPKVRAYAAGRMRLLRKHGLPLWFVSANVVWPLLCVPGECLRVCRAVVRFRWGMFRARLSSYQGAAG